MSYKIVDFSPSAGQIIVEFRPDMPTMALDIPLNEEGLFITGEELDTYISGFIPTWHYDRLDKLKAGVTNADAIEALVIRAPVVEAPVLAGTAGIDENALMWEDLEIERKVASILVKLGVLETDPTVIPVSEA